MIPLTLQDLAVTLLAASALFVFVRRLTGSRRGRAAKPSCPSCEPRRVDRGAEAKPLVFVRTPGVKPSARAAPLPDDTIENSCPPRGKRA